MFNRDRKVDEWRKTVFHFAQKQHPAFQPKQKITELNIEPQPRF